MKFEETIKKLLEGFVEFRQSQAAPSTGPDQGMTSGDQQNTFPSKMETLQLKLPKKKKKKKINERS
jgi:hypothetical protein